MPPTLQAAVSDKTAAIIAEPIQGEGGIRPLSREFAQAINGRLPPHRDAATSRTKCRPVSAARATRSTSRRSAASRTCVSVGKALGCGVPVGAALVSERVAQAISPGDHGTTYGGNLLACRAAVFFLEQLMDRGLLDHVNTVGDRSSSGGSARSR